MPSAEHDSVSVVPISDVTASRRQRKAKALVATTGRSQDFVFPTRWPTQEGSAGHAAKRDDPDPAMRNAC